MSWPEAEIDTYSRELRWILDQIGVLLKGLTPAQVNWRPSIRTANSANGIVSHVIGEMGRMNPSPRS